VARVAYTPLAVRDLERLVDFLLDEDPPAAIDVAELVTGAIAMLEKHPLLGRTTSDNLRELVISRGQSGYLALYDYEAAADLIVILGIRHQREAGYNDPLVPE
jgi:plasmid stabilization system protein ParE